MYALIYKVAGPNPFAFHAVGIVLHIITAIMVIIVITAITNSSFIGFDCAFFLSILYKPNQLAICQAIRSALCCILSFINIFLLKKERTDVLQNIERCFFILSLLSKETRTYSAGDNNISISFDIKHSHFERSENATKGKRIIKHASLDFSVTTFLRNDILLISLYALIALLYLISRFTFLKFLRHCSFLEGKPL